MKLISRLFSNFVGSLFLDESVFFKIICSLNRVKARLNETFLVFLFVLMLYVPSTIFQLNRDGSSLAEPVPS